MLCIKHFNVANVIVYCGIANNSQKKVTKSPATRRKKRILPFV